VIARTARNAAPYLGVGLLLLGASLLYHYPAVFTGAVPVEDDVKVYYFPLLVATAHALAQGHLALWSPAIFGGYPLFADGEAGMLYPIHLLLLPWLRPETALVALRVLHSALAAGFTVALLRALGTGRTAAVVGGLVYAYSGFAAGQIVHTSVFHAMTWLPLQFCFAERALSARGAARFRCGLLTGAAFGVQALVLHVHIMLMCALTVGLFVAYRTLTDVDWRQAGRASLLARLWASARDLVSRAAIAVALLALIGLVGVGVGAVQLLPILELAGQTYRGSGLDPAAASVNSIWWGDLATLLLPRMYDTTAGGYWGLWVKWETVLYVGIAPLTLAVLGLALGRGRHRVFFAGLGVLGLWLALGSNAPVPGWAFLQSLPAFEVLRSPGRFSLLFVLAVAVLAAYGVDWLEARQAVYPRGIAAVLVAGGTLGILAGAGLHHASRYLATPGNSAWLLDGYLRMPGIPSVVDGSPFGRDRLMDLAAAALDPVGFWPEWQLLLIPATALVLTLWLLGKAIRPAAVAGTLALVFVDLWLVGLTFHPYHRIDDLRPRVPPVLLAASDQPYRVYTPPTIEDKTTQVEPNRLLAARIPEANGYSSLAPDRHTAYINAIHYADNHLLDLWNVRYVIRRDRPELLPSYAGVSFHPQRPLFSGRAGPGAGGALLPDGGDARANEVFVIASLWDAGAVGDGTEVARVVLHGADGQPRSLPLLAGKHIADGAMNVPGATVVARHSAAEVAFQYQRENPAGDRYGEQLYAGRLGVDPPMVVKAVEIQRTPAAGGLQVYGVGLFDAAAGEVTQARDKRKYQLVYRDDQILVFENTAALPRAFVVPEARVVEPGPGALAQMIDGPFDPRVTALIEAAPGEARAALAGLNAARPTASVAAAAPGPSAPRPGAAPGGATVVSYADNSVVIRTTTDFDGVLVLTDSSYPGWVAHIDGRPTPIFRTDSLFRGVAVPAGEHVVTFTFHPLSVVLGATVSLGTAFAVLLAAFVPVLVALGRRAWLAGPVAIGLGRARRTAEPMAELP
jgi:hypothetical protein